MDGNKKITIKIISVLIILFSIHSCKTLNRTSISLYEADSTFVYPTRNVVENKSTVLLNTDTDKIECDKVANKIKATELKASQCIDTIQPTTVTVKTEKLKSMTDSISLLKNEIYVLKRINEAISDLYVQLRMVEKPTLSTTKSTVKQTKTDNLPSIKKDTTIQKAAVKESTATKKVASNAKTIQKVDSTKAIKKDSTLSIKKDTTMQKTTVKVATINNNIADCTKTILIVDSTKVMKTDSTILIKKDSTIQKATFIGDNTIKIVSDSIK